MTAKLKEITTQYHTFEDNQVLTKDQLNEFISYFEDQDRLTRIYLSGVGIVCGFKVKLNSAKSKITITQGVGVTTDGDLFKLRKSISGSPLKNIDLNEIEYSHYKIYEDSFAAYRFFKKQVTIGGKTKTVPLNLWEILPKEGENTKPLNTLPNIENKVVLLYLESFAKEGELCTSIDCDNQGVEQVARLRVLLVSKADADYILGLDPIFTKHDVADSVINLPEVAVRRVVLNASNSSSYENLKLTYYQALINEDKLLFNLNEGISKIANDFDSLLKLNLSKSAVQLVKSNLKSIFSFNGFNVPFNIQYRYDCVKDIVDTYNEIKAILRSLHEECCPDIKAFPKHLMLSGINELQNKTKHYRHSFYKSPLLNGQTNPIEQAKSLLMRLFEIINQFKTSVGETKITPSNKLPELSFRAIPFYYNVQTGLLNSWNYFKTEKNRQDTQLCYHTDKLAPAPHIQTPLNYNIDGFDFYRIEGHQGKDYQKVLAEIDTLKNRHGLAFDVKALSVNVNSENLNIDDFICEFEDLKVLLSAWTAEQECVLAEVSGFFSGFSTAVPGENIKEPQLNLNRKEEAISVNSDRSEREKKKALKSKTAGFRISNFRTENKALFAVKSEVVAENLTTEKDALGSVLKVAIEETKGGSVNDIIARSKVLVEEKVTGDEWKSKPEIKTFVIDQSIELMAHAHVLSQKMPNTLANVSLAQVDTYKATMANLCALVKKMKASYQTVELSVGLKAFIGIFINQLSIVCCSGKKLEILLEEINKRKESILVRLQLSKFVEKNTGLEHLAGVQPGGTFVLVYLNKVQGSVSKNKNVAGKLEAASGTSKSRFSIAELNAPEKVSVFKEAEAFKRKAIVGIENLRVKDDSRLFERFVRPDNLPNNTVIADFSLPYMCCSDCAPVNFIIAKSPVSLRLEKDEFCLGKDKSPLLFEVSPTDGVIKANPETPGLSIEGVKLMLDGSLFPDEMLGKPILFTVNDQITPTQLTVHRAVQFDFEVPKSPTSQRTILFQPSGKLEGATFLWSFGDDNLSIEQNPRHTYTMPVNEENKVTVSLTVTAPNGVCQNTVEHEIEFKVEETRIEIEKKNYCENDKESYPFAVVPAGAEAEIEGDGVRKNNSGDFVFIPGAVEKSGEITFKLNGKSSGITVTVHKAPVPKFTPAQLGNKLVLSNESTEAESYVWVINDKEFAASDTSPHSIELTPNSPTLWSIQLQAINTICGKIISKLVRFETSFKEEKITIDLKKKTFCENDKKDYKFEVTPAGSDAKISGPGVRLDTSGNFVFNPAATEPGDITFTLNGVNSELTIEVKNAPVARFTPQQIENQLVLSNESANAESFVWVINGAEVPVNSKAAHTIQLTPNSPNLWNLQLHASSKLCGTNSTKPVRFQTEFIGETANTCVDETKASVLKDSKLLVKLKTPVSDFVTPTWNATSRLYGGTTGFNKGVLNDVDNFLSGKNNESLSKLFSELLTGTSNHIVEIDRAQNKEELNRLVKLFELQLKLFYNLIACQDKATLKQFESIIRSIFERIIQALQLLKELKIILPDSLKVFMGVYAKKVTDLAQIVRHLKQISDQKLI